MSRAGSGAGSGCHGGTSGTALSGAKSKSAVAMSIPEIPSVSVWCDLWISPTCRSRSTPCTSHSSQSGWSRSSTCSSSRSARDELASAARRRERGEADVTGDVEVGVVDPDGAPEPEGDVQHPPAEPRDQ